MNELESLLQLNKMLLAESPQYLAQAAAFPPFIQNIIKAGGLLKSLKEREA